jgi:Clustered mitochondria
MPVPLPPEGTTEPSNAAEVTNSDKVGVEMQPHVAMAFSAKRLGLYRLQITKLSAELAALDAGEDEEVVAAKHTDEQRKARKKLGKEQRKAEELAKQKEKMTRKEARCYDEMLASPNCYVVSPLLDSGSGSESDSNYSGQVGVHAFGTYPEWEGSDAEELPDPCSECISGYMAYGSLDLSAGGTASESDDEHDVSMEEDMEMVKQKKKKEEGKEEVPPAKAGTSRVWAAGSVQQQKKEKRETCEKSSCAEEKTDGCGACCEKENDVEEKKERCEICEKENCVAQLLVQSDKAELTQGRKPICKTCYGDYQLLRSVASSTSADSFNGRFQNAVEQLSGVRHGQALRDAHVAMVDLVQDFANASSAYGSIIIAEKQVTDNFKKTIKKVNIGGSLADKYIVKNSILFKFAVAKEGELFNGDTSKAAKAAGSDLKGLVAYTRYASVQCDISFIIPCLLFVMLWLTVSLSGSAV